MKAWESAQDRLYIVDYKNLLLFYKNNDLILKSNKMKYIIYDKISVIQTEDKLFAK